MLTNVGRQPVGFQFQGKSSPMRLIGDAGENVSQIILRIETIHLGGL